jgi:TolA-binding protein
MTVPEAAPAPTVVPQPMSSEDVEAVRVEAAQRARESTQTEIEQRLQQFQVGVEAEKASWTSSLQQSLNVQIEYFQQNIQALEEARRRDQTTIRNLRNVPGQFSSNLPATSRNLPATSPRFKVAKGRSTLIRQPEPDLTPNLQQYPVTPSPETQVVRRKIQ